MKRLLALALIANLEPSGALAASAELCRPYATKLLQSQMQWMWNRAYTHCLNLEEETPVAPTDWRSAIAVLDPETAPPGSVPATGPPDPPQRPKAAVAFPAVVLSPADQFCFKFHKKAVWHGNRWRCR